MGSNNFFCLSDVVPIIESGQMSCIQLKTLVRLILPKRIAGRISVIGEGSNAIMASYFFLKANLNKTHIDAQKTKDK